MMIKAYLFGTALMLAVSGGVAQAQSATTIYSQDFSANADGFTGTGSPSVTPSGERYLELFDGAQGTLTANISGFTGLNLSFDLYGIRSVDGNADQPTQADNFLIYLNGSTTPAYNINLSNVNFETQDFNGDLGQSGLGNVYGPRTGAAAIGTLGYGGNSFFGPQDSIYHISFGLSDGAISTISFVGATNESEDNESYGIDNVVLSGTGAPTSAVPEPASWAMMIAGLGLIGAGVRTRRRRPALQYI